jgi:hypothetical protein
MSFISIHKISQTTKTKHEPSTVDCAAWAVSAPALTSQL